MRYLTEKQIEYINKTVIEHAGIGSVGILDAGGLNSIVAAPKQVFFGKEAYPTIWLKAAYYLQKIAKKHVFVDGNKRTAMEAASMFLLLNGYDLNTKSEELGRFTLNVTNSPDSEHVMLEIAKYFKIHAIKR